MDDESIRALLTRLARPHPSGGTVIERAAVMSEADSAAVLAWITEHGGVAEEKVAAPTRGGGLHGSRIYGSGVAAPTLPSRYVLPAGALG